MRTVQSCAAHVVTDREQGAVLVVEEGEVHSVRELDGFCAHTGRALEKRRARARRLLKREAEPLQVSQALGLLCTRQRGVVREQPFELGHARQTFRGRTRELRSGQRSGNPLVELVTTAPAALALSNEAFVRRTERARAALFTAAPLKVVVVAEEWEKDGGTDAESFEYEVTRILPASIDMRALRVPEGYRRDDAKDFENRTDEVAGLLNVFIPGGFEKDMPAIVRWYEEHQ